MRQILQSSRPSRDEPQPTATVRAAVRDHSRLRRRALRQAPSDSRARDVVQLAESRWPHREQDLAAIVMDSASPSGIRHLAATLRGRIDTDEARDELRRALEAGDARLVGTVAQSLGRIGTRSGFKALERVMTSASGVALRQIRFARLLIAHRFDMELPDLPDAAPELLALGPHEGCALEIPRRSPHNLDTVLASLALLPNGVTLAPRAATTLASPNSRIVIFLNKAFAEQPRGHFARKQVLGICARRFEASDHYSTWLLLLATPATDRGLTLRAYQPNGKLVLTGGATAQGDDTLAFDLQSVRRRGALAMHLSGTIDATGAHVLVARMGCERVDVGRPTPFARPSVDVCGSSLNGAHAPTAP